MDSNLKTVVEYAIEGNERSHFRKRRATVAYHQMRWKDAIIPYVIDASVGKLTFLFKMWLSFLSS